MADQPSRTDTLEQHFPGKYLSLTSYKHDRTGVAIPVWFVIDDRRLLVMTDPKSYRAKRIRHNPNVTIAPCTATGRLRGEPVQPGPSCCPTATAHVSINSWHASTAWLARVTLFRIDQVLLRLKGKHADAEPA